jgi:hypothetical protein
MVLDFEDLLQTQGQAMSNELNLTYSTTGLTVTAKLWIGFAQYGTSIAMTEVAGAGGRYTANMPAAAAGIYGVVFYSAGMQIGSGEIQWDGTREVTSLVLQNDINAITGGATIYVTVPRVTAIQSQTPNVIISIIGDTLARTFTIGTISGWSKIIMTVKQNITDSDQSSILLIEAIAAGGGGLIIVNGASASDSSQASLAVTNATYGNVNLLVSPSVTNVIPSGTYFYSVRTIVASNNNTPIVNQSFISTKTTNQIIS